MTVAKSIRTSCVSVNIVQFNDKLLVLITDCNKVELELTSKHDMHVNGCSIPSLAPAVDVLSAEIGERAASWKGRVH